MEKCKGRRRTKANQERWGATPLLGPSPCSGSGLAGPLSMFHGNCERRFPRPPTQKSRIAPNPTHHIILSPPSHQTPPPLPQRRLPRDLVALSSCVENASPLITTYTTYFLEIRAGAVASFLASGRSSRLLQPRHHHNGLTACCPPLLPLLHTPLIPTTTFNNSSPVHLHFLAFSQRLLRFLRRHTAVFSSLDFYAPGHHYDR